MSSRSADQAKEAIVVYQQKGDLDTALGLLEKGGWKRSDGIVVLLKSDLTAARATTLLAIVLLAGGGAAWSLWPDTWWLLVALLAWGVERAFRAMKLVRRAKAIARS